MSKLLTILSKLNRAPVSGVVPPDIHVSVARDLEASRSRRRYVLCGAVCICAVLLGIGVRIYFGKGTGALRQHPRQLSPQPVPVVQPMPSVQGPAAASKPDQTPAVGLDNAPPAEAALAAGQRVASAARKANVPHPRKPAPRDGGTAGKNVVLPDSTDAKTAPPAQPQPPVVDREARDSSLIAARSAEKRKAYAEALRLYNKALTHDQDNHMIMNNAASMHIRLGNYAAAVTMSEKALLLARDYIPALINQGIARSALGNRSGAAESFARAVELDPANRGALYNLALFDEKNGNLDASAQVFKRLAATGDLSGMIGLARIYEKQSRMDEAMKSYADIAAMHDIPADARNTAIQRLRQLRNR